MPRVTVTVDGARYTDEVPARTLLVHYLRDHVGKIGTVVGCDTGNCGACTVHLTDPDGVQRAVKSCSVLAVQADGAQVSTVESLGGDHPMQRAFHEQHALQCGYCTPGMIIASVSLLEENPDPNEEEIREALEGNYCRCTGYENIIKAVQQAAGQLNQSSTAS